ncbi:MAG: hypothetical protein SOW45_02775 [Prevotella sp.]|nr:hypothetical protein [Prevotella sp.]
METLLIICLLACNAWLLYILSSGRKKKDGRGKRQAEPSPDHHASMEDIIGKSRFRMSSPRAGKEAQAAIPTPHAATSDETEEVSISDTTFADEIPQKAPMQVPADRLDEVFTDMRIEDADGRDRWEESREDEPMARGTSFEDIDKAVATVRKDSASDEDNLHAGKVFTRIETSELYDSIVSSYDSVGTRVRQVMDMHLSALESKAASRKAFSLPDSIEDFDVRKYV